MNKGTGFAVFAAIAITALHLSSGPGVNSPPPVAEQHASLRASPAVVKKNNLKPVFVSSCTAYAPEPKSPVRYPVPKDDNAADAKKVLDKFFRLEAKKPTGDQLKRKEYNGTNYAIAIVPDPRHTNLSVMFDRQMVAIQQAAQDEKYTYNSSWLPWSLDSQAYQLLADQQYRSGFTEDREACPGILLFRHSESSEPYKNALVVFVVGEQPTGGVNQAQWDFALEWLKKSTPPKKPLRILGPTFSGSLASLNRDLQEIRSSDNFSSVQVLSGTVSSCSAVRWFLQQPKIAVPLSFGTFQENDDLKVYRLLKYLNTHGSDSTETAILSEDETAYGMAEPSSQKEGACHSNISVSKRPVEFYYPRDMSALRAEYQKESVFSTGSSSTDRQPHAILQEGAEPDEDSPASDTIPAYSGHVTPLAQEAVLFGIVSQLRTHHTHYLLLRCTNPLDYIFLTRFFHRAYPEGRIVTVAQDLLFRREIDTTEFRGVMALSNYPLLPRDESWRPENESGGSNSPDVHRIFDSHLAQGTYLAASYSFIPSIPEPQPSGKRTPAAFVRKTWLPGYADPAWLNTSRELQTHAPTWLTVVGRDGFWPVAVWNGTTIPREEKQLGDKKSDTADAPDSTMVTLSSPVSQVTDDNRRSAKNTLSLPLPWQVCALCVMLLAVYQVYGMFPKSQIPSSGPFSVFRAGSAPSQQIILGFSSAMVILLLLETASVRLPLPTLDLLNPSGAAWVFWICKVGPILGIFSVLLVLCFRNRIENLLSFVISVDALLFLWSGLYNKIQNNAAANVPLFYRMGHLTSGVSPLLPILLLSAGFYFWTWQAMAGNLLLCKGRPLLPPLKNNPPRPEPRPPDVSPLRTVWLTVRQFFYDGFSSWLFDLPTVDARSTDDSLDAAHYRISHVMEKRITKLASPLSISLSVMVPPAAVIISAFFLFSKQLPLLSLEGHAFNVAINSALLFGFILTVAETSRLFWTWFELRKLLTALNRLRLRRTFARLRAVPASSLWGVSGDVQRIQYSFFAQQLDAAVRLSHRTAGHLQSLEDAVQCGQSFAAQNADKLTAGPCWDMEITQTSTKATVYIREVLATAVADVLNSVLLDRWAHEKNSLSLETSAAGADDQERNVSDMKLSEDEAVGMAEEFVCFHYIAFIQNILARMRTMVLSLGCLFVAVCFAISFYPFVPRTQVSVWMMLNLALITTAVIYVYAGMERDETLSYIANTKPGHLSAEFWIKTASFLAGPILGILTTQFPAIADSILGWLQPGLEAIKG